jgi:dihydroorotate dehydrogenase
MNWYPDHPPIYDISKTYLENFEQGPFFHASIPKRKKKKEPIDFLGHKIASPLGVPAGPLLNSRWIALAAKLGFDVLVYKTIRSFAHPGHKLPNMIYVEATGPHTAQQIGEAPRELDKLTVTNSFGMPSRSPDFLIQDIDAAKRSIEKDQLLIVSIVGTPNQGMSFRDDFVRTAQFAKAAGAPVIEANFSCPNVDKAEGSLYTSPEAVREYAEAIAKAIHPIPLILKVGEIENKELLRKVLQAAARGGARAVCGLNSVAMTVTDGHGKSALGPGREQSGVCGGAIRSRALQFVHHSHELIHQDKLGLALLGCGGIESPVHFGEFLEAGAQIAMSATGMMWDPMLAMRYHNEN